MDARTVLGKTVFFILICLFVSAFSGVFGQGNSLTGVIVIVLALTMLSRDLSIRPVWNLGVITACTLAMGVFSFLSVWLGNPFVGAVLNFAFVFGACFYAMHDLNSPMHFPFLLGYAFMLSAPVPAEDLHIRLLALVVGSVLTVALNVAFHRVSRKKRERDGIIAICSEIGFLCASVGSGTAVSTRELDRLCARMNGQLYERLKSRFISRPGDRRLLDIVLSLQVIGTEVCLRERDPDSLKGVSGIMDRMREYQSGADMQPLLDAIDEFLLGDEGSGYETRAAMRALRNELWRLAYGTADDRFDVADVPASFRIGTVLRESLRLDSARFTFSFRMALMFSICAFVWQYTGDENAKALVFTTIAMVHPYLEGTLKRTAQRIAGTVVGILAAIASLVVAGGDLAVLTAIMLAANYVFTVASPMRYDIMMAFITLSSLLTAIMTNPPETILTERVALIFAGVAIATIANRVVFPYRLKEENRDLLERYMGMTMDQIRGLGESAHGRRDPLSETAVILKAATVSSKIRTNVTSRRDLMSEMLLSRQDNLTARIAILSKSMAMAGSECRNRIAAVTDGFLDGRDVPADPEGLEGSEADMVREAGGIIDGYRRERAMFEKVSQDTLHHA